MARWELGPGSADGLSLPRNHLARPRLIEPLLDAGVAVIEAPAGYGKSALASEYRAVLGVASLWVPLAPADADIAILASSLRRALRAARLSDLSSGLETAAPDQWADRFLDLLSPASEPLLIVLDDAHHLTTADSASLVLRLARGLPAPHRLVVAARRLPAELEPLASVLGVARLRLQQLAFSQAEASELLTRIHGSPPGDGDVRLLMAATEGWASALVLAATALAQAGGAGRGVLTAGSGRGVIGPLLDGVLGRLTPADSRGVAQLAQLPYLSAEVAAAVSGDPAVFQRIITAGVPLARTIAGRWEMPGPVADYLARRAPLEPAAARAAAQVYLREGDVPTAVRVLLGAGQRDQAAALLAGLAPREAEDVGWAEIRAAAEAAGPDAVRRHPRVLLHLARVAEIGHRRDVWREALDQAGQMAGGADLEADPVLLRELRAERAADLVWDERTRDEAAALAQSVADEAGPGELAARARALETLGRLRTFWSPDGPHDDAQPLLAQSARLARQAGYLTWAARALMTLAVGLHFGVCRYNRALAVLDEALVLLPARSQYRCFALSFRADVLAWLGRYAEAGAAIEEMRQITFAAGQEWMFAYVSWSEAGLRSLRGDREGTVAAVLDVRQHQDAWTDETAGIEFLAQAADLLDRVGEHQLALDHLDQARRRKTGFERVVSVYEACVLGRSGDPAQAEEVTAAVLARPDLDPQERWRIMLLRAYAACRGRDPRAGALAAAAFGTCRDLGIPDAPLRCEPAAAQALLPLAAAAGSDAAVALLGGAATVSLTLLGGFELRRGGRRLDPPAGRPAMAVRAVAAAGGRMRAEQLIEILWPTADAAAGRNRLKNLLSRLRAAVGEVLVREEDTIALVSGSECDAALFEAEAGQALALAGPDQREGSAALARAALARAALTRYRGELLPDDRYDAWAAQPRERLRLRYLELLDLAAAHAQAAGDVDDAVRLVQRAIDTEPYDEDRYLRLATLLASQGRAGSARAALGRARAALDELGLRPSADLLALERSLTAGSPVSAV